MKNNFIKGAAILVIANFVVKIIGVVYKIPLTNIMGGEGMGYFSSAFDIYLILFSLSTAGLPVAVSRMIAESHSLQRYSEINKIIKVTFCVFLTVGILGSLLLFFGAGAFANLISNSLAKYSIMALAPSLFFMSIMSIFRGYFQGLQNMNPTALSQICEAFVKLTVGVSLALVAVGIGLESEYVSAFAIFGTTTSTIISGIILLIIYRGKSNRIRLEKFNTLGGDCRTAKNIVTDLIKIVIPVTIGSVVVNLTGFLDLFLIISRLQDIGHSESYANFIYGSYKAFAYTLFNLPTSIIATLNLTIIPAVATAHTIGNTRDLNRIVKKGVKITSIFAFPCAAAFIVFANPILHMMYPGKLEEIQIATPLLQSLGISVVFLTLSSMFTAILQAVGKERVPVKFIFAASAVKLVLNYILIGIPSINILGATIGTIVCYLMILGMNYYYIQKNTQIRLRIGKIISKSFLASVVMVGISGLALIVLKFVMQSTALSMLITIPIAMLVYVYALSFIGGIDKRDVEGIPKSQLIAKVLRLK